MTNFTAANYLSNAARTEAEVKQAFEDNLAATKQLPGGGAGSTLTLATDQITPTAAFHLVDTQGGASTDNLAQILQTNLPDGSLLMLSLATNGHTVVVKHAAGGTGQISLVGAADFTMSNTSMNLLLRRAGTQWEERDRYYGTATAAHNAFYGAAGLGQNTFTGRQEWNQGATLTAASTLGLGTDGNYFAVAGTATITAFSTTPKGTRIALIFLNAGCLLVHNPASLVLAFGNYLSRAGDILEFVSHGAGVYREVTPLGAPRVLDVATTNVGVISTTATVQVYTYMVQANVLGATRRLRLTVNGAWNFAAGGGTTATVLHGTAFTLYMGGVLVAYTFVPGAIFTGTTPPSGVPASTTLAYSTVDLAASVRIVAEVAAHGATNNQRAFMDVQVPAGSNFFGNPQLVAIFYGIPLGRPYNADNAGGPATGRGLPAQDSTVAWPLQLFVNHSQADALNYFILENAVLEILP